MCKNVLVYGALVLYILFLGCFAGTYTSDWIVYLKDNANPDVVAELHDFDNLGRLHKRFFDNVYHFRHKTLEKRHSISRRDVTDLLNSHEMIEHSEQDEVIRLDKRNKYHEITELDEDPVDPVDPKVPNDPSWKLEWHLNPNSTDAGVYKWYGYNIDVQETWNQGYNGSGVVVCVIDDGLEKTHPDLASNYDPLASYDLQDDDNDPSPRYSIPDEPNRHGTRCAGEIAAVRNNNVCGVGVAYACSIGGIRILDGPVTRIMESKALGFNTDHIDIFSASWGPPDNGKAMDGPKGITAKCLEEAIKKGRDGKGTIYVWAGGNGGKNDDCNADGYQTMRGSVSISAVGLNGDIPYYAEPCACALASTFSSGFVHSIATTDIHGECTTSHSGTSAAAPIAAGIVALALQANPDLTWRDVQHIITWAAIPDLLYHHDGWVRNAVGRATHINFGYGILDANRMVNIALNWTNVGIDLHCQSPKLTYNSVIAAYTSVTIEIPFDGCNGTDNTIRAVEHVYLVVNLSAPNRGDITIGITSPSKTEVQLISKRTFDNDNVGFVDWSFATVFLFGENPDGPWTVVISNTGKFEATLKTMYLDVYGTKESPIVNNVFMHHSNDSSVCKTLCDLADRKDDQKIYDSANRCENCKGVVKVDIERRNRYK